MTDKLPHKRVNFKLLASIALVATLIIFIELLVAKALLQSYKAWDAEQVSFKQELITKEYEELTGGSLVGQDVSAMDKYELLYIKGQGSLKEYPYSSTYWDRLYEPNHSPGAYSIGVRLNRDLKILKVAVLPNPAYTF